MKKLIATTTLILALGSLAACGSSTSDRAISGAGIGAATGAVAGAATGGSVGQGALIGGAIGGAAGGLTKKEDINLGKPVWR